MLTETSHALGDLPDELADLDLTESDEWIGVTVGSARQHLVFGKRSVVLPRPIYYPKVAAIDSETAVVVDTRTAGENNAWIISANGEVLANFFAGDAIEDVLASERWLVFTYFDESACSSPGIEGNGITVFDSAGNYASGYREVFSVDAVDISDCYAACWSGKDQICFFSYMEFPLVRLDLPKMTQQKWETPTELRGSHAITARGSTVYFHGPYNDKSGIYAWEIGHEKAERIGERHWRLRSIRSGRFLVVGKTGFTIIELSSDAPKDCSVTPPSDPA